MAWHLLKRFLQNKLPNTEIFHWARDKTKALEFSAYLKKDLCKNIPSGMDAYILCVSDDAIPHVANQLLQEDSLIIHTSGSTSISVLSNTRRGVLYPMQTFSKNKEVDWDDIVLFLESDLDKKDEELLQGIAHMLSYKTQLMDSPGRMKLHIVAVFACNFVNHLWTIGEKLAKDNGIEFTVFLPLINETYEKFLSQGATASQTGPALRGDISIQNKHTSLLKNIYPELLLAEMYSSISDSIYKLHHN